MFLSSIRRQVSHRELRVDQLTNLFGVSKIPATRGLNETEEQPCHIVALAIKFSRCRIWAVGSGVRANKHREHVENSSRLNCHVRQHDLGLDCQHALKQLMFGRPTSGRHQPGDQQLLEGNRILDVGGEATKERVHLVGDGRGNDLVATIREVPVDRRTAYARLPSDIFHSGALERKLHCATARGLQHAQLELLHLVDGICSRLPHYPHRVSDDKPQVLDEAQRRRLWTIAAVPLILAVAAYVGQILSATLADKAPILLIALAPADAFLILTVNEVPTWAFFVVGFIRLIVPDPFLYRVGYEFGPAARSYLETELGKRSKVTKALDVLDRWFPRAGGLIVFGLPNYPVCLVSGMTRMHPTMFAALNVAGTATRLYVIWRLGRIFSGPAETVLEWITRYQLPFAGVMLILVMFQVGSSRRKA